MTAKNPMDAWNELNPRQQTYLRLIYQVDQESEQAEALRWRSGQPKRSADSWRWQLYANTSTGPTQLKRLLLSCNLVDPGTGSTLVALETRGLIQCRHEFDLDFVWIRLTTQGRKVARTGLGEQAPKKLPTGTLREWHWQALAKLYAASEAGLWDDGVRSGYYGEIGWNTWLRLRDYKAGALMQEASKWDDLGRYRYGATITPFGRQFYEQNWKKYRDLYPDVDAPEPDGGRVR